MSASDVMTSNHLLEVARTTVKAAQFCFLVTADKDGESYARLMQPFEPEEDLTVWLGMSPRSRKFHHIRHNTRVLLAYPDGHRGAYVTLSGSAEIETDVELRKRHWRNDFAAFWPDGPTGDDYVLIRFVPSRIELMSAAEGIAPEPYGLRAAVLTREGGSWAISPV